MKRTEMRACRQAALNESCRVCLDKAHGFHFGVMVCRACAAFFRRTIALNMQYFCRFQGKCIIDKSVRCMCRACRHSKCVNVGMKAEAVQLNRDSIRHPVPLKASISPSNSTSPPPVPSASTEYSPLSLHGNLVPSPPPQSNLHPHNADEASTFEGFNRINAIFEDALQNPRTLAEASMIEEFQIGYTRLRTRRPFVHTDRYIDAEARRDMNQDDLERALQRNWEIVMKQHVAEFELIAELISYIRPFVTLPPDQRWLLFKNFWLNFVKFERAYDTYRLRGNDVRDKQIVMYNGQVIDILQFTLDQITSEKRNFFRSLFRPAHALMRSGILGPMKQLNPTEFEFAAYSLHLLWLHPGNDAFSEESQATANYWRREIFNSLHEHYVRDLGLSNYAARLGDYMALLSTIEKNSLQKKENMIVAEVFSLVNVNPMLLTVYKQV
uniref:Nuclear receptor domain-containing protein n=1 Tax=Panagrellus redivivus TaxID=6233 RepID=A0A7E4ZVI9_PANRE